LTKAKLPAAVTSKPMTEKKTAVQESEYILQVLSDGDLLHLQQLQYGFCSVTGRIKRKINYKRKDYLEA
jgi:hypothetical protein